MNLMNRYEDSISSGQTMDANRYYKKYQQLSIQSITPLKVYSYGVRFYYSTNSADDDLANDHILVRPKYKSLKEELLMNEIMVITLKEFNNEYQKAMRHYNSDYSKSKYRPHHNGNHMNHMTTNHILSMMIYTNYTEMQYLFTKTYYHNIHQHNNFYHLGRFLKQSVHIFGKRISDAKIRKFYHGINQQMTFPSYIKNVCIGCPLSTSTDFDVAVTFATNNGMVVEFSGSNTKYICVEWVSDYPHEHECLFIQNNYNHTLTINNIIHTNFAISYKAVLHALRTLDKMMSTAKQTSNILEDCSSKQRVLIKRIIEEQLTPHLKNSFNDYAVKMIDTYFNNQVDDKRDCIRLLDEMIYSSKQRLEVLEANSLVIMVSIIIIIGAGLKTNRRKTAFNNQAENIINKYFDNHDDIKDDFVKFLGFFYFYVEGHNSIKMEFVFANDEWALMEVTFFWDERYIVDVAGSIGNLHWRVLWDLQI